MSSQQQMKDIMANNLKEYANNKGVFQSDIAKELQLPETTVSNWFKAKTYPRPDKIQMLADYFGISRADLTEDNSHGTSAYERGSTVESGIPLYDNLSPIEYINIDTILDDVASQRMHIPREILGKYSNHKNLVAIQMDSAGMNNVIPYGSYAIVKPIEFVNVKDDDIVIFKHDGECIMRRIRRIEEDKVVVFSPDSSDRRFRDIVVPYSNKDEFEIYAKVIWYSVILD
ncbi:LexA family transcriptional regulator [Bacillus paranthracis]|uniref:LexA family transcriptional regulator n=1 Tax=Bacillus paranthracis TaxID=2026186 RepID=UPI0020B8A88E|nr:XRE family transcriptional regulator [Bacillus paranthracis]